MGETDCHQHTLSLASQTNFSHAHALAGKNGLGTPAGHPAEILEPIRLQDSRDVSARGNNEIPAVCRHTALHLEKAASLVCSAATAIVYSQVCDSNIL